MTPTIEEQLRQQGRARVPVQGSSMGSAFAEVDAVHITHARPRLGQLVLFRHGSELKVHRLIFRFRRDGQAMFLCRGDACPHFDPAQPAAHLLGPVVAVERNGQRHPRTSLRCRIHDSVQLLRSLGQLLRRKFSPSQATDGRDPEPPA